MCFFFFFWSFLGFFVFGREEKYSEIVQVEHRTQEVSFFFFLVWRVPGAFSSPDTLFKAMALQGLPLSNFLRSG